MPVRLRCDVAEIIDHGEAVYSLLLQPERPAPRFLPGQFLHLAIDDYQPGDFWPDSRPFSIASPPEQRDRLRLTYAVKGVFTARMQAELRPGASVWVKLPYGEFTVRPDNPACLLAGGTGVTAFTAFLSGLPTAHPHPVWLFYGARRPDLLIYRPQVEAAAAACPALQVRCLSEEAAAAGIIPGRLDLDLVWREASLEHQPDFRFYLSGPPGMLQSLAASLRERGVPPERILTDAWE